jgi:hypothetical protein
MSHRAWPWVAGYFQSAPRAPRTIPKIVRRSLHQRIDDSTGATGSRSRRPANAILSCLHRCAHCASRNPGSRCTGRQNGLRSRVSEMNVSKSNAKRLLAKPSGQGNDGAFESKLRVAVVLDGIERLQFLGKDIANPSKFPSDCAQESSSFHRKRLQFPASRVVAQPEEKKFVARDFIRFAVTTCETSTFRLTFEKGHKP